MLSPAKWIAFLKNLAYPIVIIYMATHGTVAASHASANAGFLMLNQALSTRLDVTLKQRNGAQSTFFFRKAVLLDVENRSAWRGLGFSLTTQDREEEALASWTEVGGMLEEFMLWGDLARESGRQAEALSWYGRVLANGNDSCSASYGVGSVYRITGDWVRAVSSFADCKQSDPRYPDAQLAICETLLEARQFGEAIRRSQSTEPSIQQDSALLACTAVNYWYAGDFDSAARYFERASLLRPEKASFHQWLSLAYMSQGRATEALTESLLAISLDDGKPDYWYQLGQVLFELESYLEAKAAFEKVLELDPARYERQVREWLQLVVERLEQP